MITATCPRCFQPLPCSVHRRQHAANERGYNYRWQQASAQFKRKHPLCRMCESEGVIAAAFCVDHIIPHRGNMQLFWDRSNWQALCKKHHNQKSARE